MKNVFYLAQVKKDKAISLQFNRSLVWMDELLVELEEDYKEKQSLDSLINFSGWLSKKHDGKFGIYLLLEGDLKAAFNTYCIKTGDPMLDTIDVDVSAAILDGEARHSPPSEDDTVCLDHRELDLYYYSNNCFDMQKIFHEYLFLNKDPYPQL